ncbi:MAG: outer membrane beta-barrel protein [Candidatus Acidiferrum sp.]
MKRALFCVLAMSVCLPAMAQQTDINRYTLYTGFDYLISPARNLTQRGFDVDFGVTVKSWLGLGGDFSASGNAIISGSGTINGSETVYAPTLTAAHAQNPLVPLPNMISVPFKSTTYTFAVGPQFYIRKWKKITFLARPGLGGIHESADLTFPPGLGGLFQLLNIPPPNSHQSDLNWFIGLGGGFDLNLSRHVGLRFTADWINTHLFSDLLTNRQNYARFTIGPTFRWGHLQ